MLELDKDTKFRNLNYLNQVLDEDSMYLNIVDGVVSALDYVNKSFPRFESEKTNLGILLNNIQVDDSLKETSLNLEFILDLIDGFDVISNNEVNEFYQLAQTFLDFYQLPNYILETEMVLEMQDKVFDNMLNLAYLGGEIDSISFEIDLHNLNCQLDTERKYIRDSVDLCNIDLVEGSNCLINNTSAVIENSIPYYLPVLKEKAKRVDEFILSQKN